MKEIKKIAISTLLCSMSIGCTHSRLSQRGVFPLAVAGNASVNTIPYNNSLAPYGLAPSTVASSIPLFLPPPDLQHHNTMSMSRVRRSNNHCGKEAMNNRIEEIIAKNFKLRSMQEVIDGLNREEQDVLNPPMVLDILYDIFYENKYRGIDYLLNKIKSDVGKNQCSLSPDVMISFMDAFRYNSIDLNTIVNFFDFLIQRIDVNHLNDKIEIGERMKMSLVTWLIKHRKQMGNDLYVTLLEKLVQSYGDKIKVTAFDKKKINNMWIDLKDRGDDRLDTIVRILIKSSSTTSTPSTTSTLPTTSTPTTSSSAIKNKNRGAQAEKVENKTSLDEICKEHAAKKSAEKEQSIIGKERTIGKEITIKLGLLTVGTGVGMGMTAVFNLMRMGFEKVYQRIRAR